MTVPDRREYHVICSLGPVRVAAHERHEAAQAQANAPEIMGGLGYWQDPSMRPEHSGRGASHVQTEAEIAGAQGAP